MYCKYREKKVQAGDYMEVSLYPVFAKHKGTRKKAYRATSEVQKILNKKNAVKQLTYLLNTNFTPEDIRLDLTFKDEFLPDTEEEAWREVNNFFRRIKRNIAKNEMDDLKYIAVLEGNRWHFHIVCNLGQFTAKQLRAFWGKGYIGVENLEFGEFGLAGLARYMMKNPRGYRSWRSSRNLRQPEKREETGRVSQRKVEEVSELSDCAEKFEELYPGYAFAGAEPFYNDFNGYRYLTVRMHRRSPRKYNAKRSC